MSSYEDTSDTDGSPGAHGAPPGAHTTPNQLHPPNQLSKVIHKCLLIIPITICLAMRSLTNNQFRTLIFAWSIILNMTSKISVCEAVLPALMACSLNFSNQIVRRNMYIAIARSRLGLLALLILSFYSNDCHIFCCGVLFKVLVEFSNHLIGGSVPVSEVALICNLLVNAFYYVLGDAVYGNATDPVMLAVCGLLGAIPCYPILRKFVAKFRQTRGKFTQWPYSLAVITLYLLSSSCLYFHLCGVKFSDINKQFAQNGDLVVYWGCILFNAFVAVNYLGDKIGLDGRRKLWHVTSVMMFLPNWVRIRVFTKLALGAALVIFVALETMRATVLPPWGYSIHQSLQRFIDHRDKRGPLIISHLYLLLGISIPLMFNSAAGLICLGLGDTAASQIGRRFGRLRFFGDKSLEGTLAFAVVAALGLSLSSGSNLLGIRVWIVVIPTALMEAVTPVNDNLVVPAYMMCLERLALNGA